MDQLRRYAIIAAACSATMLAASAVPQIEIQLPGKFGEFRVINRGETIQLNSTVKVQQKTPGGWQDAPVTNLRLRASCEAGAATECMTLAAGASLQPPSWTGSYCSSQCLSNCNLDGPAPPGTYRYVISSCDGEHKFVSPPFEKKPQNSAGADHSGK